MPTKVIVVGCGIAGPVLALLLKQKGYEPVIYERGKRSPDAGLSLMLQLNGLRVLSLIPGLVEQLPGMKIDQAMLYSIVPSDERILGQSDYPAELRREYGKGLVGVQRPKFLALLSDTALAQGIPIHFERQVVGVEQEEQYARVLLNTGETDTASIVVGCDGLHSNVRISLFGAEDATFTGLTQLGGITSSAFPDHKPTMFNFYGDGLHVISYAVSEKTYSWALTRREPETKETWRAMDAAAQDSVRNGPLSQLPFGVGYLVQNAEKITKYGLYDRPELKSWHKGRVVLIGDAAHPTSPHLGQGANQAFEDVYHLIRLFHEHHPSPTSEPSAAALSTIFTEFEAKRMERTATLVRGARKAGEIRVVEGPENVRARNDAVCAEWAGEGAALQRARDLLEAEEADWSVK
ncbi:FAD/NAD(P)-binding domain-containing protein [Mycena maculata]|uniref:FAD/NAD(P)-binding domain-containing protein n=1 Tax=Mycena maculata TaxID=230809 RepID=A0AAD7HB64_9AGAR|nr:FAD/NAD(P)-binding domain-containing protein [Mycena maculata]